MGKNTPKPWDRLPKQDSGTDDINAVYIAIGRALTEWENLQDEMSTLFAKLIWCDHNQFPAARAFGTLDSAIPKVKMMLAAAEYSLHEYPELLRETNALLDSISRFNHRRNDIAHGIVYRQVFGRGSEPSIENGHYLAHGISPTSKVNIFEEGKLMAYMWTADQIGYYEKEFKRLRKEASALSERIPQRPPMPA